MALQAAYNDNNIAAGTAQMALACHLFLFQTMETGR
jgi:hypothetical protein